MGFFDALRAFVNSIPPCDRIDCIPDFLENIASFFFSIIDLLLSPLTWVFGLGA